MLKKKLLTFAAAAFCVALVTAQSYAVPTSLVKASTAGLIEDGVIDSLPFGNEEGNGVVFGEFATGAADSTAALHLGWGNSLSDTLWLSVYDAFTISGSETSTESVTKAYGAKDGVNPDYTDERPRTTSSNANNSVAFENNLAVGVAFNNTFGVQAGWYADWTNRKDVATAFDTTNGGFGNTATTIKSDSANSTTGQSVSEAYDNIKNYTRRNMIFFNFKGAGIENDGEVPFWAKLSTVYVNLNFNEKSNDWSKSTSYLGSTKQSESAKGINQTITIKPGVVGEVGFNLKEWGVVKPSVAIKEQFDISFDIAKYNTSYTKTVDVAATTTTTTVDYEKTPGKKLVWNNTLTPAFVMDFQLMDELTLKTSVSAGLNFAMNNSDAATYKTTKTNNKEFNKGTGHYASYTTTTTEWADTQNVHEFTTSVIPAISLGLVYQLNPGKTNINFGVNFQPGTYSWKTTERTNSNINYVTTSESVDAAGMSTVSKTVNQPNGNTLGTTYTAGAESREVKFTNGTTSAIFNIGATYFFTENAKLDVWYQNNFATLFKDTNTFGAEFSVMF